MQAQGGRDASLSIGVYPGEMVDGGMPDRDFNSRVSAAFAEFTERYQIRHYSRVSWSQIEFRTTTDALDSELRIVDVPYSVLHRVNPARAGGSHRRTRTGSLPPWWSTTCSWPHWVGPI